LHAGTTPDRGWSKTDKSIHCSRDPDGRTAADDPPPTMHFEDDHNN